MPRINGADYRPECVTLQPGFADDIGDASFGGTARQQLGDDPVRLGVRMHAEQVQQLGIADFGGVQIFLGDQHDIIGEPPRQVRADAGERLAKADPCDACLWLDRDRPFRTIAELGQIVEKCDASSARAGR